MSSALSPGSLQAFESSISQSVLSSAIICEGNIYNVCLIWPIYRLTLSLSLFSKAPLDRFGFGSCTSALVYLDLLELDGESLTADAWLCSTWLPTWDGFLKIVGTASGLRRSFFFIPMDCANRDDGSKHSLSKWSLQSTAPSEPGPLHLALVLWTCLIHFFLNSGFFGNWNRLTPSLWLLEQLAATQRLTILSSFAQFTIQT